MVELYLKVESGKLKMYIVTPQATSTKIKQNGIVNKLMVLQIQEAEQIANRINWKKSTPKHIIVKLLKTKDEQNISEAVREKTTNYKFECLWFSF